MLNAKEIDVLGNLIDTTWGKSSTNDSFSRASYSVTAKLHASSRQIENDRPEPDRREFSMIDRTTYEKQSVVNDNEYMLVVQFFDVLGFDGTRDTVLEARKANEHARQVIALYVKQLKKLFKEQSTTALKMKQERVIDNISPFNIHTAHVAGIASPRSKPDLYRCFYKMTATYSIK